MAKIVSTVHVTDPDRPGTSILLEAGQTVPDHLAGQITNPDCWEDGKLPDTAKDHSSDDRDSEENDTKPAALAAAKKTATKKASAPARGRNAADLGTSGE
ncbi:hypothetical protein [Streptomyces sp. NPDC007074]|uniref:hypothetical protein n=1 Tax=Streptomyces sp. NPDC007074 TaxID=3156764 RepID=UPI0033EFEB19